MGSDRPVSVRNYKLVSTRMKTKLWQKICHDTCCQSTARMSDVFSREPGETGETLSQFVAKLFDQMCSQSAINALSWSFITQSYSECCPHSGLYVYSTCFAFSIGHFPLKSIIGLLGSWAASKQSSIHAWPHDTRGPRWLWDGDRRRQSSS